MIFRDYTNLSLLLIFAYNTFLIIGSATGADKSCSADGVSEVTLSIKTYKNSTGHRLLSVDMDNGRKMISGDEGVSELYLTHNSLSRDNEERVKLSATTVLSRGSGGSCPTGYVHVEKRWCYKLTTAFVTWYEARDLCKGERTHLIIINSEEEAQAIKRFREVSPKIDTPRGIHDIWVGISDEAKEGDFQTVQGEPISSTGYQNWYPTYPNGGSSANCIYLSTWGSIVGIADRLCTETTPFICEFDP